MLLKLKALFLILVFIIILPNLSYGKEIVINIPSASLELLENEAVVKSYKVALGSIDNQTPIGNFKIVNKIKNPTWIDPKDLTHQIPSGARNPLGYRWIGIGGNYGIHGTNNPNSIGTYTSNGCIRMYNKDVEELFNLISPTTKVSIKYERYKLFKDSQGFINIIYYKDPYQLNSLNFKEISKGLINKYTYLANFISPNMLEKAFTNYGYNAKIPLVKQVAITDEKEDLFYGFEYNYIMYIPVYHLANISKTYYEVEGDTLKTNFGEAQVEVFGDIYYLPLNSIKKVFPINYGFLESGTILITKK